MYLGGFFVGVHAGEYIYLPLGARAYSNIKFYGGATIIDKVKIYNKTLTEAEILAVNLTATLRWDSDTILMSEFYSSLDGGNVINLPNTLTGFQIYRRETNESVNQFLAEVPAGTLQYIDYFVNRNREYVYQVTPITATAIGSPIITQPIKPDFYGWYLMDYDNPTQIYKFDLDLQSGTMNNEVAVGVYNGFTQKPVVAQGDRDYITGSIECFAGYKDENGNFVSSTFEYINSLREFINNKSPKLLKSRNGDMWKIITYGLAHTVMDNIGEQPAMIKFDFCEIK